MRTSIEYSSVKSATVTMTRYEAEQALIKAARDGASGTVSDLLTGSPSFDFTYDDDDEVTGAVVVWRRETPEDTPCK